MKSKSGIYLLIIIFLLNNSCRKDKYDPPSVNTADVSEISYTSVVCGGTVLKDGGDSVLVRGICWSISDNPTVKDNKTTQIGGLGSYKETLSQLAPGTKYYVRAYATNGTGTGYGGVVTFTTLMMDVPVVTTHGVTSVFQKSAMSGGTVTADNGSDVIARGVCWSLSPDPSISDYMIISGADTGSFVSLLKGLKENTSYYLRAFASNRIGTGYGDEVEFKTMDYGTITDIDGNSYRTITIGAQEWMADNLKVTTYNNGEAIPNVTDDSEWSQQYWGAYCWYDNSETTSKVLYGALYNWFTVVDSRNLCPGGWHVPDDADWTVLADYLVVNGYGYEGSGEDIAKSMASASGWSQNLLPGTIGNEQEDNNSSGFEALPGGVRIRSGMFSVVENTCSLWSASDHSFSYGNALTLSGESVDLFRGYTFKQAGASVRCLKDN